jgi:hypothetical protein
VEDAPIAGVDEVVGHRREDPRVEVNERFEAEEARDPGEAAHGRNAEAVENDHEHVGAAALRRLLRRDAGDEARWRIGCRGRLFEQGEVVRDNPKRMTMHFLNVSTLPMSTRETVGRF